jgi:hypothetical protein
MPKRAVWGKLVDRSRIDTAVSERDIDYLAAAICAEDVAPGVREYLADIVSGVLTGKRNFARSRPKKRRGENEKIGEQVWLAKRNEGLKKISSAIDKVARDLGISDRTVWKCWKSFDVLAYELRWERVEHDFLMDMANEARRKAAILSLKEHTRR